MKQIVCKNLEIGYDKKIIMGSLNMIINQGDYWCITGENGAGKSSILEALDLSIGTRYYSNPIEDFYTKEALALLINSHASEQVSYIDTNWYDTSLKLTIKKDEKNKFEAELNNFFATYSTPHDVSNLPNIDIFTGFNCDSKKDFTLLYSYYPSFRITEANTITNSITPNPTHDDTHFNLSSKQQLKSINSNNSLIFNKFLKWLRLREDIENEKIRDNREYNDPELGAVKSAVKVFLDFEDMRVFRNPDRVLVKKNENWLDVKQLSDGERAFLCLVGDIARRLSMTFPSLDNPLTGKCIVMIDEIELHLHPKWQRRIIPKLLTTFPNCQFFITTHSPQVIGEVEAESIWILEQGEQPYHPERSYGMESSELLGEVMGAESANQEVVDTLSKIEALIDKEDYDNARKKITELAEKTGKIPSLIGINSLLTMYGEEQANIGD